MSYCLQYLFYSSLLLTFVSAQSYEDKRCRCICPSPEAILSQNSSNERQLFIANVPPSKCNCDGVILPRVGDDIKGREQEFCPRCDCKYESRNTTVIKVVVVIVIWVITLLIIYMSFIICLDPLTRYKKQHYHADSPKEEMETLLNSENGD